MKRHITETIEIPEGINCSFTDGMLSCTKDSTTLTKALKFPGVEISVKENTVVLESKKGNQNQFKAIKTFAAHVKNLFNGLTEEFTYQLESANVHFPMTLKVEGDDFVINNFLGEKTPRHAKILPNVKVEVKGQNIVVTSHDREAAGQTAANLEKATKVKGRDRRIFQDGIYITEKPGRRH